MAKERPDEKNMHAGHRMRVIESYSRIDLDALSPHQVLEYILFYVFPRGDVNPLAHRLLSKYGSVQNVLDANPNELCKVYGINERSAQLICGFTKIFNYYTGSKLARKYFFGKPDYIFDFCEELLRTHHTEVLYAIAVDPSFHVINTRTLGTGNNSVVCLDTHEICNFVNETKASSILLTHNHPGGYCNPTENDIEGTKIVKHVVEYMGCHFIDHVIVGCDGVYSIALDAKTRTFSTNDNIKEFAESIKAEE